MSYKNVLVFFLIAPFFNAYADTSHQRIDNAIGCSSKIGSGGNYYSDEAGKLLGKCQGNVLAPSIYEGAIVFAAPPKITSTRLLTASSKKQSNDRTELAFTNTPILYNKDYLIDFKVQISSDSDETNAFYYLMQIWQSPEYSPIFGLRVDRGTKDRAAFVVRNKIDSVAGKRLVRTNIGTGLKHFQVYLNIGDDLKGRIKIYENSNLLTNWTGSIGYPIESSSNKSKSLLLKFGLYKGPEPSKNFKVTFKDVSLKPLN